MNLYLAAAGSFVLLMAMSLLGASMMHLKGPEWYMFMGLLSALGISLCGVFLYLKTRIQGTGQSAAAALGVDSSVSELDQLVRTASGKLAHSNVTQGQTIANVPLIFVMGDRGTSKTTSILQSGLEPELLAGQVYQQSEVTPTRSANIWYARGFAYVEAGGALLGDPASWVRLVKNLQPGKLKSAAGNNGHAPRAVLLCVSLESFLAPGASAAMETAARYLNARLSEISEMLGINFPVYVLFTKMDRVPFFTEYVRMLSNEEAGQIFGATLPMRNLAMGVYAEEETGRITGAFNNLFTALCDHRTLYLPREDDSSKLSGAYEFPREFRKLRAGVTQFLVDVCRPSQLRASPFLRGFYFSGVRPVVMSDAMAARVPNEPRQSLQEAGGATRMFRVGMQAEVIAQQSIAQPQGDVRKVPQWTFLTHLFHGLIMQDSAALGASVASIKTNMLTRVLSGVAAGLCLLYCMALTISFLGNRALEEDALKAAQNITGSGSSEPVLRRLETLRQSLDTLAGYERNGHPLSLSFGLYAGSRILPEVRTVYFNKFKQVLFGEAQNGMLAFLKATPSAPGPNDEYGTAYDTLKSYLLTAPEYRRTADKTLQAFLANDLWSRWRHGKEEGLTRERSDLAKKQFEFYSEYLHEYNPYPAEGDKAAVEQARFYLSQFSGADRVYQNLLTEAAKGHAPVSFNDGFKNSAAVVTSTHPIAFAYTKPGADFMLKSIRGAKFGGEQWVLGNFQAQAVDKSTMEKGVLDRYSTDYIKQWRTVLQTSKVNRYANLADASAKLMTLTGSEAPLLALFWWTSQNTSVEVPGVTSAFRSVQQVVPPSTVQQYVVPANTIYNTGLIKLQGSINQAATVPTPDPATAAATVADASAAKLSARQITSTFPVDNEAHLEATVNELMLKPITNVEELTKGIGAAEINGKGRAFCAALDPVTRKFPFNSTADAEVTLDELNSLFKAKDGKLSQFQEILKPFVVCNGADCAAAPNAPAPVDGKFVNFIKQAVTFSRALYPEGAAEPSFRYTLKPLKSDQVDEFDPAVNGEVAHLNGDGQRTFLWPGSGTPSFRLDLKLAGGTVFGAQSDPGLWGVFRFFADSDVSSKSGAGYTFRWNFRSGKRSAAPIVKDRPLSYDFFVDTNGAPAVFSKDFLAGLRCVGTVAH